MDQTHGGAAEVASRNRQEQNYGTTAKLGMCAEMPFSCRQQLARKTR